MLHSFRPLQILKDIQIAFLVQKLRRLSWMVNFACWWSCIGKGLCAACKAGLFSNMQYMVRLIQGHSRIFQNINDMTMISSFYGPVICPSVVPFMGLELPTVNTWPPVIQTIQHLTISHPNTWTIVKQSSKHFYTWYSTNSYFLNTNANKSIIIQGV